MPKLDEISYSRDTCVKAIRDYYRFLTQMYLPETEIIEPPEGGWPTITNETLQYLGKTPEVVALLRELPYMQSRDDRGLESQVAPLCYFADWQDLGRDLSTGRMDAEDVKPFTEGLAISEHIPPHVFSLTQSGENLDSFLIDTELGVVIWVDCPGEIKYNPTREKILDDPYDYAEENEAEWRGDSAAWAIPDFFELLKDHFCKLKFVPVSATSVVDVWTRLPLSGEGLTAQMQSIYREHAWPDSERFCKEECLEAMKAGRRVCFPEYLG